MAHGNLGTKRRIKTIDYDESTIPEVNKLEVFIRDGHVIIGHPDMQNHCYSCGKWKNQAEFSVHSTYIDPFGRRKIKNMCHECNRYNVKIHQRLHRKHGPAPSECELCGEGSRSGIKIQMDVEKNGLEYRLRGWLCADHNTGLGRLKDDPFELIKGMEYLVKDSKLFDRKKLKEKLIKFIERNCNEGN